MGGVIGCLHYNKPWSCNPLKRHGKGYLCIGKGGRLIGDNSIIYSGADVEIFQDATFSLGKSSFINLNCKVRCRSSISIGDNCVISENVMLWDSDEHSIIKEGYAKTKPIEIGNHCWIGCNSIILKGVKLGDGCVVAAGSVVTKSFGPKCLIGGVPAKVIQQDIEWQR